jgi:hypothetical protein
LDLNGFAVTFKEFGIQVGSGAKTTLDGGILTVNNGYEVDTGVFEGGGQVNGDLSILVNGVLDLDTSVGALSILGNLVLGTSTTLQIEIASATDYGFVDISGTVALNGTLQVNLTGGYQPPALAPFTIITASSGLTGTFTTANNVASIIYDTASATVGV